MPETQEFYQKEGKLERATLDCVVGEILRIWPIEMADTLSKSSKESFKSFERQISTVAKELDQII